MRKADLPDGVSSKVGEWWKHLRPYTKRLVHKTERRLWRKETKELKEEYNGNHKDFTAD